METPEHQEWRARQRVSWRAISKTALFVGAILFVMSGGSPWSTAGTMNAVMGRDLPLGIFTLLALHLLVAFIYVAVFAHVIYRLRLLPALLVGLGTGLVLYGINFAIFRGLAIQMQSPEGRALFVHITFSLMASAVYKAMSVPKPFWGNKPPAEARVEQETDAAEDPEPQASIPDSKRP